jgi:hypothetical protein
VVGDICRSRASEASDSGRPDAAAQHVDEHAHRADFADARNLEDVVADHALDVQGCASARHPSPTVRQEGLGKAPAFEDARQRLFGSGARHSNPLLDGDRVQAPGKIAAGQRFAALAKGIQPRAARDQQGLPFAAAVEHPLQP